MPHKDKYRNFAELQRYEEPGSYKIVPIQRDSDVLILAPHGGGIEPGTSEIARTVAGRDCSLYLFEGKKETCNYDTLHITSSRFDEPECLKLLDTARIVVAIHGCAGSRRVAYIGGLAGALRRELANALSGAGYDARADGHHFPGENPRNVCNRGQIAGGVQLEITRGLRDALDVDVFARVIRGTILE